MTGKLMGEGKAIGETTMTDPIEDFMNDESIPANFRTALMAVLRRDRGLCHRVASGSDKPEVQRELAELVAKEMNQT